MVFLIHICLVPKARLFLQWQSVTLLSGTISHFLFILLLPFQCLKCFVKEAEWSWTTPMGFTDACSLLSRHSVQVEKQFHNSRGSATSNCSLRTEVSFFLHLRVGGEALSAILSQACIWKLPRAVPQGACAMCQFSLWKSLLVLCGKEVADCSC